MDQPQQHPAKRKRDELDLYMNPDNFLPNWTEEYYFIMQNKRPLCLLCMKLLSDKSVKKFNIKRHYEQDHVKLKDKRCELSGQMRTDKINKLRMQLTV